MKQEKLTVPTNEGQNVVGEEELKTLGDGNIENKGSNVYYDGNTDNISGGIEISDYLWSASGALIWQATITEYDDGSGCDPKITIDINTLNAVITNISGNSHQELIENNRTKIIESNGIISPYFIFNGYTTNEGTCSIHLSAPGLHFHVTETIYDNERHMVIGTTDLLNRFADVTAEIKLTYNLFLKRLEFSSAQFIVSGT